MDNGATFKVPRLYKAAAKVIRVVREDNGNLEQLVQLYNKKTNTKALAALVSKTLDNEGLLDKIIQNSEILVKEANADPWLFRILITELLLGKQRLPIGSKPVQTVLAYGPTLRTELLRAKGKLHKTQKRFKSETDIKEADPECKQESSTHNQTRVFGKRNDKKKDLNSTMQSNSLCTGAQDYIKLEEDEDIQSKHIKHPKKKQKKQDKRQLPSEQVSGFKQKRFKLETGVKEADPECKQDSSTHNQTQVFGKHNDKKKESDSTMQSNSWCAGAQDYIKLEEDEDIQSKHIKHPKKKQKKQNKRQLPSEQVSGFKQKRFKSQTGIQEVDPECKQDSSTHNQTQVFGKHKDKKKESDSTMQSNSWCAGAKDYIKLEKDEDIQSKHTKHPKKKQKKQVKKQLPSEQISGFKIKRRKHNMRKCGPTPKKHKVESPLSVHKSRYFE